MEAAYNLAGRRRKRMMYMAWKGANLKREDRGRSSNHGGKELVLTEVKQRGR